MRVWLSLIVVVLVVGCGKNRPAPGTWPAQIVSHDGFSEAQWKEIRSAVDYLNTGAGKTVVFQEDQTGGNYPIHFRFVDNSGDHATRAGLAIYDDETCTIEVSSIVFLTSNRDTLVPVINHELGHCAGLDHDPKLGEVMYRSATNFKSYTPDSFQRFFQTVLMNVGE